MKPITKNKLVRKGIWITEKQAKKMEKMANKFGTESAYIRSLIK